MNTRNKPCACGSGKKSKHCCGNEAERTRRAEEARLLRRAQLAERRRNRPPYARSTLPIILGAVSLMNSERR